MAAGKHISARKTLVAGLAAVGCASALAVGCIGYGIASAGNTGAETPLHTGIIFTDSTSSAADARYIAPAESLVLETTAPRDVSRGFQEIADEEERARIAAEEAAREAERQAIAAAEAAKAESYALQAPVLPDVDFTCGRKAFVEEWTARIDAYLAGSALEGRGADFAVAAWENGIDPRWSPAISNTESTKGANCFRPYNAWGWMSYGWTSWEQSIYEHARGLSQYYGFTISVANARKYCPPTYLDWYEKTLAEMRTI